MENALLKFTISRHEKTSKEQGQNNYLIEWIKHLFGGKWKYLQSLLFPFVSEFADDF